MPCPFHNSLFDYRAVYITKLELCGIFLRYIQLISSSPDLYVRKYFTSVSYLIVRSLSCLSKFLTRQRLSSV